MNFSAYFNLLKAMVGTGIILYPGLIQKHGIFPTLLYSFISLFFSLSGMYFYIICNSKIGKKSTISSITDYIWKPLKNLVFLVIISKCFLVTTGYMKTVFDILKKLTVENNKIFENDGIFLNIFVVFIFIFILPVLFFEKLDKLKFTSFLGICNVYFMIICSFYWVFGGQLKNTPKFIVDFSIKDLGQMVFGFTCHQNIFTVQNELNLDKNEMLVTILSSGFSAYFIYMIFGILNSYLPEIKDKTYLQNVPNTTLGNIILLFYLLIVIFSIPLQMNPCQTHLLEFLKIKKNQKNKRRILISLLFLGAFLLSKLSDNLQNFFKAIGSTVSTFLCFLIPTSFYFLMRFENLFFNLLAFFTGFFGIFVMITFFGDKIGIF